MLLPRQVACKLPRRAFEQFANKNYKTVRPCELISYSFFFSDAVFFSGYGSTKVRFHNGELDGDLDGWIDDHEDVHVGE